MLFAMLRKVNAILLVLLWTGCAVNPAKTLKGCRYQFKNLAFTGMEGSQTHWQLDFSIYNPNVKSVDLVKMHFAILHASDTLLSGWNPNAVTIAAGDSQMVSTLLDLPNAAWKQLPANIWSDTAAQFQVTADAYLQTWLGAVVVPYAVHATVTVNMPAQVAKYRDMMLQKLFSWPGKHLGDDSNAPPRDPQ